MSAQGSPTTAELRKRCAQLADAENTGDSEEMREWYEQAIATLEAEKEKLVS